MTWLGLLPPKRRQARTDLAAGLLGRRVTVPDTNGYAPVSANIAVARVTQVVAVAGRIIRALGPNSLFD